MQSPNFDNADVGQVHAHPKAAMSDRPARSHPGAGAVAGRMMLAVVAGAFFGYLLSIIIAPTLALAFMIGGAMSFGAVAVALFLMKPAPVDEYTSGFARTEKEVREALADIQARDK